MRSPDKAPARAAAAPGAVGAAPDPLRDPRNKSVNLPAPGSPVCEVELAIILPLAGLLPARDPAPRGGGARLIPPPTLPHRRSGEGMGAGEGHPDPMVCEPGAGTCWKSLWRGALPPASVSPPPPRAVFLGVDVCRRRATSHTGAGAGAGGVPERRGFPARLGSSSVRFPGLPARSWLLVKTSCGGWSCARDRGAGRAGGGAGPGRSPPAPWRRRGRLGGSAPTRDGGAGPRISGTDLQLHKSPALPG